MQELAETFKQRTQDKDREMNGNNSLGGHPLNQIINAAFYCLQLDRLHSSLVPKRPGFINRYGVILHHDNARPDAAVMTGQKLMGVVLEVFPHPPYSLDLAPTDYPYLER
ncbi:transposase [Trichonephila clavipes]|nr:transposase [Trichonephila clavipes]